MRAGSQCPSAMTTWWVRSSRASGSISSGAWGLSGWSRRTTVERRPLSWCTPVKARHGALAPVAVKAAAGLKERMPGQCGPPHRSRRPLVLCSRVFQVSSQEPLGRVHLVHLDGAVLGQPALPRPGPPVQPVPQLRPAAVAADPLPANVPRHAPTEGRGAAAPDVLAGDLGRGEPQAAGAGHQLARGGAQRVQIGLGRAEHVVRQRDPPGVHPHPPVVGHQPRFPGRGAGAHDPVNDFPHRARHPRFSR